MNNLNKPDIQRIIAARLEELGLTRLSRMFSAEHNVPRGTHKIGAVGGGVGDMLKSTYDTDNDGRVGQAANADTVDGKHASDLAPAAHGHAQSDVTNLVTDLAGKAAVSHAHAATDITSGTLDGDRLAAATATKRGGVPPTGTPSGKFHMDDDTWAIPAGGGLGYALSLSALNLATLADGATYYFGNTGLAPQTGVGVCRVYIPKAGTIKSVFIFAHCVTPGSEEDVNVYIRKNDTTNYLVGSFVMMGNQSVCGNIALSISVNAADWFEIKIVCPTWVTNPANARFSGSVYIE